MTPPRARTQGLLIETVHDETLVYDAERDEVHCLDTRAAAVWHSCDGQTELEQIAARTSLSTADAAAAILALAARHLLEPATGVSRRDMLRTVTIGAAAVAAGAPVIKSIVAPTAAQAASCQGTGSMCSSSSQCCSGLCSGGTCT
jgi:hypothetical protein